MIEVGEIYLWNQFSKGKYKTVFVLSVEDIKPIYKRFKFLVMDTNETINVTKDKFQVQDFLCDFKPFPKEKKDGND